MNLVIDIGNTQSKFGIFKSNELVSSGVFTSLNDLSNCLNDYPKISAAIYCCVGKQNDELIGLLKKQYKKFIVFNSTIHLPLQLNYKTPQTLGSDRLAASIGGMNLFPHQNLLIINMGSCITYDIITSQKEYLGGKISPGAQMRLKALNTFTAGLPLIELSFFNEEIGQSTDESILAGTFKGIVHEIEGTIEGLNKRFQKLEIIITGGDAALFVKAIKKPIFTEPFLVLKGLNFVLGGASPLPSPKERE